MCKYKREIKGKTHPRHTDKGRLPSLPGPVINLMCGARGGTGSIDDEEASSKDDLASYAEQLGRWWPYF